MMKTLIAWGIFSPLGAGRPISVAWMKGRSRAYALKDLNPLGKAVILAAFTECCGRDLCFTICRRCGRRRRRDDLPDDGARSK